LTCVFDDLTEVLKLLLPFFLKSSTIFRALITSTLRFSVALLLKIIFFVQFSRCSAPLGGAIHNSRFTMHNFWLRYSNYALCILNYALQSVLRFAWWAQEDLNFRVTFCKSCRVFLLSLPLVGPRRLELPCYVLQVVGPRRLELPCYVLQVVGPSGLEPPCFVL